MSSYLIFKPALLALLFIKEQLKEPVALFWTVVSPVVTYYLISYARAPLREASGDYLSGASWFYAFIASSVAMFGLAFYIVGRRESGFLRSFVYTRSNRVVFLVGQWLAYSFMSIVYCSVFYVLTRGYSGVMGGEILVVMGRFYICFVLFSIPALLLTLAAIGFQNTSTVFSMLSLTMLAIGIASVGSSTPVLDVAKLFNPMWWANQIMLFGVVENMQAVLLVVILFVLSALLTFQFLRINPVWSRY